MLPFYWVRRRRIRKLLPSVVLNDPAVRETLFAIEQIGPLVDNFAFEGAGGLPLSTSVALADIAFFYMQLADEFLDEVAAAAGGHDTAGRLVQAIYRSDTSKRPLYDLSLGHLRKAGLDPDAHTTKFGTTLSTLFDALDELALAMDRLLANADNTVAHATHLFLHHCFQTYLDEAELCQSALARRADRIRLQDTAWHFYRKNNMVMMLWLDLRARLLGLEPATHATAIRQWGYLLAAFQIFDDLKDIAIDLGKQPSYPLQIAANDFPAEFAWIEQRFGARRRPVTCDDVPEVNTTPCSTLGISGGARAGPGAATPSTRTVPKSPRRRCTRWTDWSEHCWQCGAPTRLPRSTTNSSRLRSTQPRTKARGRSISPYCPTSARSIGSQPYGCG
jgi:hypothetical protein